MTTPVSPQEEGKQLLRYSGESPLLQETAQGLIREVRENGKDLEDVYRRLVEEITEWIRGLYTPFFAAERIMAYAAAVSFYLLCSGGEDMYLPPKKRKEILVEATTKVDGAIGQTIGDLLAEGREIDQRREEGIRHIIARKEGKNPDAVTDQEVKDHLDEVYAGFARALESMFRPESS